MSDTWNSTLIVKNKIHLEKTLVAVGENAGASVISSGDAYRTDSVLIGTDAGYDLTLSSECVCVGNYAAQNLAAQAQSVIIGHQAAQNLVGTLGQAHDVIIGWNAARGAEGIAGVIIGHEAGSKHIGNSCVYIGTSAGKDGGGDNNVFIGKDAAGQETDVAIVTPMTCHDNVCIGHQAGFPLFNNEDPDHTSPVYHWEISHNNVIIGSNAAVNEVDTVRKGTVQWCTIIGDGAGRDVFMSDKYCENNTFVGHAAGEECKAYHLGFMELGHGNTCVGNRAGRQMQGYQNTYLGGTCGSSDSGGIDDEHKRTSKNVCIGFNCGQVMSGTESQGANVLIGHTSGMSIADDSNNTFVGTATGQQVSGHDDCTFLGFRAGYAHLGDNNIAIGQSAGYQITSTTAGSLDCIMIGYNARAFATDTSSNAENVIVLGNNSSFRGQGAHNVVVGSSNTMGISELTVNIGNSNVINNQHGGLFVGTSNTASSGNHVRVFGDNNSLSSIVDTFNIGDNNTLDTLVRGIIIGHSNTATSGNSDVIVIGKANITNQDNNVVIGQNHSATEDLAYPNQMYLGSLTTPLRIVETGIGHHYKWTQASAIGISAADYQLAISELMGGVVRINDGCTDANTFGGPAYAVIMPPADDILARCLSTEGAGMMCKFTFEDGNTNASCVIRGRNSAGDLVSMRPFHYSVGVYTHSIPNPGDTTLSMSAWVPTHEYEIPNKRSVITYLMKCGAHDIDAIC